ncbi:AAEL017108-PA [Aedes aegypti]|uniref:AAEL017108-PA n=1 Tax=Aedes aegypti TaxID=7159 RepID=J9HZY0_AEDAE|nr:AAEL017108-PA [Aedes aegypti]
MYIFTKRVRSVPYLLTRRDVPPLRTTLGLVFSLALSFSRNSWCLREMYVYFSCCSLILLRWENAFVSFVFFSLFCFP